ncbi:LuxR family transcriptional regulator [Saccharopolyspora sp. ASAGF58]|nr:LuxR family transcriptional regulator [Saccharopolyspora sp. ASAGF58]
MAAGIPVRSTRPAVHARSFVQRRLGERARHPGGALGAGEIYCYLALWGRREHVLTQAPVREAGGLPHELTSFVGRREATAGVKHALADARLVTLIGFGGVGKSRLAVHVASELRRAFPDGVHQVELAKVQDVALVPQAVAAALGLHDQTVRDATTVVVEYLADRKLLLVLDNCEHLVHACAALASTLLASAPELRVLATSREPLGILGEQVWPVPPLSVPAADEPLDSPKRCEALTLFEQRAAAVSPGFTLGDGNRAAAARLCQRLDGIPLAIELAAVRVRALSVEEILNRLENRFQLLTADQRTTLPRHQTLRATVDWSYELCTEAQRLLWARCSVFAGEFSLNAVEAVCAGEGLTSADVLQGVTGLIDKSVLNRVGDADAPLARYWMLDTIRHYGRQRLAAAGEDATLRRQHRDYYLGLAEQSDAESAGPRQGEWIARLRAERPNLWAALDYCLAIPAEIRTGLRLSTALWFYWIAGGSVREGRHWLDRALALDTEPSPERARALWLTGWIAICQGDVTGALSLLEQSRRLAAQLGDTMTLTDALQAIGCALEWNDKPTQATALLDEALARHRASGRWTAPGLLNFAERAQAAALLGDTETATALLREARTLCMRRGERWALSWTEWGVGLGWWRVGKPSQAALHLSPALRKKQDVDDRLGIVCCVELLSWVAVAAGNPDRADVLLGATEWMWERIGRPLFDTPTLLAWRDQARVCAREALGEDEFESCRRQGSQMNQHDVIALALGERAAPAACAPAQSPVTSPLTKREREVAALVTAGKSNSQIAASLVISQRTAEAHVEHILTKLGFTSRCQIAAAWAAKDQQR